MIGMRAVVAAVLVAGLATFGVVATNAIGGETTTPTTSTSGGCLPPSLAADLWAAGFPESNGSIEDLQRDCEQLCGSHMRKCRTIVRIARTCNSRTAGVIGQLQKDVCNTYENQQTRRECRESTRRFTEGLRQCVREDALRGRQCCETNLSACVADCIGNKFTIQQCFTGGSCLFDAFNSTL